MIESHSPTKKPGPPGVVVHHVPAATRQYVGCPSIVILPDGGYLASHSYFGPGARNTDSFIYRSEDEGASWRRIWHSARRR